MGFFHGSYTTEGTTDIQDMEAFEEACMISELASMSDEERTAIFESEGYQLLEERGLIGKKTRVTLNKEDDMSRRETMAALQLAKEGNDRLFDLLALNRVKERDLLDKIRKKYGSKARRAAAIGQKEYIKTLRNGGTITKKELKDRA